MELIDIVRIVWPIALVGAIAIFVINRLKHKQKLGTLGKKKTKDSQNFLDSLIPLGMLAGCALGMIFNMFLSISFLSSVSLGAGIGLLFGYFSYEFYSKSEDSHP